MTLARKISYACSITAMTLGTAAIAQEDERYFNGFYVSGAIGSEYAQDSGTDSIVFDTNRNGNFNDTVRTATGADAFSPGFCAGSVNSVPDATCNRNRARAGYAIRAGVDKHIGDSPIVVGALIEGARPGVREFTTGFSSTPASYTFGREIDWTVSGRARVGFSPGDGRGLFYATGGAGYARIDRTFATSNAANSFTPTEAGDWKFGWQAGGGAEIMLTRKLGIGFEYLYSKYKDDDFTVAVGPGTAPASNPFLLESGGTNMRLSNDSFDFHALRGTVSLRF